MRRYRIYEHIVILDITKPYLHAECKTCSLSRLQNAAVIFMYEQGIHSLTVEGCEIQRIN